jgi:hypothetical protein
MVHVSTCEGTGNKTTTALWHDTERKDLAQPNKKKGGACVGVSGLFADTVVLAILFLSPPLSLGCTTT